MVSCREWFIYGANVILPFPVYLICSALEQFVRKKPDYVNLRKDDGFTAIHLASLNDHLDVVTALADMVLYRACYISLPGVTLHASAMV